MTIQTDRWTDRQADSEVERDGKRLPQIYRENIYAYSKSASRVGNAARVFLEVCSSPLLLEAFFVPVLYCYYYYSSLIAVFLTCTRGNKQRTPY